MEQKPSFPEVAPVIEVWPGFRVTLMADFNRFSNGSLPFAGSFMQVNSNGKKIGEIGADGGGRWIVKVEDAWYSVNMEDVFESILNAHIASL